jgi:catecholate siderophore receptor
MTPKHVSLRRPGLRPLAAALGVAALLPLAEARAQSVPPKEPEKEATLPEVKATATPDDGFRKDTSRTATRTDTPMRDIPQFVNQVPETVIRSQNATSLQEALRNVPGITYAAGEGGTQANQVFYLRGFPAGGDIFIDGVRDLGEYNRDLFATESVDVLKGPSALMFGRGSTGGLINQVSKAPSMDEKKEVSLTLGDFHTRRLVADANLPVGFDNAARAVALVEESGNFRYPQDVKRVGFAPSVKLGIGNPTEITLAYYYLRTEDVTDYGQPTIPPSVTGDGTFHMPPVSPRSYYGYANADFSHHQTHIATATIDHRVSESTTLRNTLRLAKYKRQVEATIPSIANVDRNGNALSSTTPLEDLLVTRNHDTNRTRDNDDDAVVNQTDVTWKLATGRVKHTVLAGLELAREKLDRWNYALDANPALAGVQTPTSTTSYLHPDPSTPLSYTKTPNVRALAQADTVAAFVQDQLEFSPRWKALLGTRFERYKAEARTENIIAGTTASGPFGRTDRMWSGRAGLIFQPSAAQSYYLAAGNSYNPSGELGVYGQNGTNLNPTNEDLAPERNVGFELGATWDVSPGLQLRSALFRNEKANARKLDESGATLLNGKRRVDGIELQLTGRITPQWDLYSGAAFMHGDIVSGPAAIQGHTPLGVPSFSGNVWTVYRLPRGFEVGGGLRGSSSFELTDANNGKVPGSVVGDITAAWLHGPYEVRLNVNNVADKTYYVGGYQNVANRVLPGAPRQVQLTLRYTF